MAIVVSSGGDYIARAGGYVRRWEPANYVLVAGETGFLGYPSLADLKTLGLQGSVPVALPALQTTLTALTTTQKNNIWTNFTAGKLWQSDTGANAGLLQVMAFLMQSGVYLANATDLATGKVLAIALYVLDNPSYLVHPAFDATINVPGTQLQ